MPRCDIYCCNTCREEILILSKCFNLAPLPKEWGTGPPKNETTEERDRRKQQMREWEKVHLQTLVCDPCELMLFLPRQIEAVGWREWKREDLLRVRPHTDYPFLVKLARRVDNALAGRSECVMDFGQLVCPYCTRVLVAKDELSPNCKRCGSSDLEYVGSGIASMSASFPDPWPPIA